MGKLYAVLRTLFVIPVRLIFLISVKGRKNEPERSDGAYLVCANHISALDPIFICAALRHRQVHYMAKAELFKNRFLARFLRALGAFPVNRSGADAGVLRKSCKMIEGGECVGLFPQGTRRVGVDPRTTQVRNGAGLIADSSRASVLPVYIKTKDRRFKLFRRVTVVIGEPVLWSEYTCGGEKSGDYGYITKYVWERICALKKEGE